MCSRYRTLSNKKKCRYFVVPGNRQALLGMPDIDVLNYLITRKPMGLKLSPLKTSFLAAVQV